MRKKVREKMAETVREYRKAIAAFIVPALVVLGAALSDGVISPQEWVAIAVAALGTSAAVGAVANDQKPSEY